MNLKHLSNEELHTQTLAVAERERKTTIEVLWHLREIESRMLYAQKGYRDLKEYCVRELKYSEGSAWRRISAMKLLKDLPEIQEKIESGDLNLTQLNMAQTHFREVRATKEEKTEVLSLLENQNTKSTERVLAECMPESIITKPDVKEKAIKGNRVEVTLILDEELQKELEEIQVLMGKPMSKLELLRILAKEKLTALKKQNAPRIKNPKTKDSVRSPKDLQSGEAAERKAQPLRSGSAAKTRYVSKFILKEMKARDQHQCQYKDPKSGRQCSARFYLQTEHRVPFAKGGTHELKNLQLLCPAHNRLRAVEQFGVRKMQNYLPGLRL